MSEKINGQAAGENGMNTNRFNSDVDAAFDPEKRQAQQEWDAYLEGRRYYKDEKGNVHDSQDGQKFAKDNVLSSESEDDYYSRMLDESENPYEASYANSSMMDLAETVRDANKIDDKTTAEDAYTAFIEKFYALTKKYGWSEDTINARLDRFTKIMNGEDSTNANIGNAFEENSTSNTEDNGQADGEYAPRQRAENVDEDTPMYDKLRSELGIDEAQAHEGESLGEYEARQPGRHVKRDGLEFVDGGAIPIATPTGRRVNRSGLESVDTIDESSSKRSKGQRLRDALTPAGLAAEAAAFAATRRERGQDTEKRKRTRRILGALALVGLAGGAWFASKHGVDLWPFNKHGGTGTGAKDVIDAAIPKNGGHEHAKHVAETITVHKGDGEIKIDQRILAKHGINVNTTDAQRIGERAGVHPLVGEHAYDDAASTLDRIGVKGGTKLKVRPGAVQSLLKAARELGFRK